VTLVLLPGVDGTGQLFAPFVAALGQEFNVKVVAYPTAEPLGYDELESIARAALPADGPYVILGESFSGPIAISLAASDSARLKGLILCCSFVSNPRPAFSALGSLVAVLPLALAPVRVLGWLLLGHFSTRALQGALAKAMSEVSPSAIRARLKAVLSVNVSAKLSKVKVPVMYLRGSRDRVVPASASALVGRACSHMQVVELEAPHFLLQALTIEAAREVVAFMRDMRNGLNQSNDDHEKPHDNRSTVVEQASLLRQIDSIQWNEYAQPEWNKLESVALALASAAAAADAGSCSAAYHRVLYAFGNNHAGTYYPVVLAAFPILNSLLRSAQWPQRVALCLLDDLFASFHPEPGFEVASLHGDACDVELAFRAGVCAFGPLLQTLVDEAGPNALLASGLLSLVKENDANPPVQ